MRKIKINRIFPCLSTCMVIIFSSCTTQKTPSKKVESDSFVKTDTVKVLPTSTVSEESVIMVYKDLTYKEELISDEDVELIALITMAEAEGECEEGKRLVIDTILNRVDSEYFPDTIYEVIYQPYHFSSIWNGRVDRCEIIEDICRLVREEVEFRTNYEVIFFTSDGYSEYGVPMFQVGNHYFSRLDVCKDGS